MAFSLLLFLFFLEKLKNDISLIKWIPVGMLLNLLLFGDQFGFASVDETSYFKFYTAPAVCYIVCIISLIDNAFIKKYNALFFQRGYYGTLAAGILFFHKFMDFFL